MVPSAFVFLPELPLTSSGKVDRASLPPPPASPVRVRRDPQTDIEQAVAQIWQELLPDAAFGIDDDFFELGGHSLLATRVAARLRHLLRVDVPVRAMFDARTVEQLSAYLVAHEAQPGQTTKIARALTRTRQMSASEREALLAKARA
jgi:acyl carrier protein